MLTDRKLRELESRSNNARLERIAQELARLPERTPTKAELLKLKTELAIPDAVFADLFPEFEKLC
jgi:hypothetical protein